MVVNKCARMMITMMNDIFGFFMMNAICKSVFLFSDLIMSENVKVVKVVGNVFLMIKNGPGSWFHKCTLSFNGVADNGHIELTYEIATQSLCNSPKI